MVNSGRGKVRRGEGGGETRGRGRYDEMKWLQKLDHHYGLLSGFFSFLTEEILGW